MSSNDDLSKKTENKFQDIGDIDANSDKFNQMLSSINCIGDYVQAMTALNASIGSTDPQVKQKIDRMLQKIESLSIEQDKVLLTKFEILRDSGMDSNEFRELLDSLETKADCDPIYAELARLNDRTCKDWASKRIKIEEKCLRHF